MNADGPGPAAETSGGSETTPSSVPEPTHLPQPGGPATVGADRPARRRRKPLAFGIASAVVLVAVISYSVAGYVYAASRIGDADAALSKVVNHQNTLASTFNELATKLTSAKLTSSSTIADMQRDKTLFIQLVSDSQAAVPTIDADDAALVAAQKGLRQQEWLTVFSRSRLDQESAKVGHARKALADARTIAGDYVQLGEFYQAFFDTQIDWETLTSMIDSSNNAGAASADATLQTDLGNALQLTNAPGLPAEAHQYELDFQALAVDIGKFLAAVRTGDTNTAQSLGNVIQADATKFDSHDWSAIDTQIAAFYQPLIDDYNSEAQKAVA